MLRMTRGMLLLAAGVCLGLATRPAAAETGEIRVVRQYGIGFLPLMMMEHDHLFETAAKAAGLAGAKATWATLGGPAAANDALLSGSVDVISNGPPSFITMWAKTRGNYDVKGIASMISVPMFLNTSNPRIRTLDDFTDKDKIAVSAVKVSIPALVLEMAAAAKYGDADYARFDPLTVSLPHPEAMAALLSRGGEIDAHFGSPPFQYEELQQPGIHTVVTSDAILGGPTTFSMVFAASRFRTASPRGYTAFLAAFGNAIDEINHDQPRAAQIYLDMSHDSRSTPASILAMLRDPHMVFTTTPQNFMRYADFMYRIGRIKQKPASWKDLFFPEVQNLPGS